MMDKESMRESILEAKAAKGMTWERLAEAVGVSPVFLCSVCLGENSLAEPEARLLCEQLDLAREVNEALQAYPVKGQRAFELANDPLIYRFNEIVLVYGETLKEIIHEKFGDGIMSAIDFSMNVDKVEDPKGDRVLVTLNGKFLPYRRW